MRRLTEQICLQRLRKKHDVRIDNFKIEVLSNHSISDDGEIIVNPAKAFDLGNKSWGMIDFLINCCGYRFKNVFSF